MASWAWIISACSTAAGPFLPEGQQLEQADGTAWMGMFCLDMLAIALELTKTRPAYEAIATKFFEHFVAIAHAINGICG